MDGEKFADKYTCQATGKFNGSLMPQLDWTPVEGAKSYAITFIDVTLAPAQPTGYHWAIWNIPASTKSLPEGMKAAQLPQGAKQTGDFLGPCPNVNKGSATALDNYEFTIYALPQETTDVSTAGGISQATKNAEAKFQAAPPLATAKLTGKSDAVGGL